MSDEKQVDDADPWQAVRIRRADQPDPARLKHSGSPFAPDWAKQGYQAKPKVTPTSEAEADQGLSERAITSFGKPLTMAPEVLAEQASAEAASMQAKAEQQAAAEAVQFHPDVDWFERQLWALCSEDQQAFALIDGEFCRGLYGRMLNFELDWAGLWQGDVAVQRAQDAPFLVALQCGHRFNKWLIEENWGRGCIVWIVASVAALQERYARDSISRLQADGETPATRSDFTEKIAVDASQNRPVQLLKRHLRRFTEVEFEEDGRLVDFRFYDPAVLRTYLLSCNSDELDNFFGPICSFLAENFSSVASLNQPRQLYQFRRDVKTVTDENCYPEQSSLLISGYNVERQVRLDVSHTPTPTDRAERKTFSGRVLIRKGQAKAYAECEMSKFAHEASEHLIGLLHNKARLLPLHDIINAINLGKSAGLSKRGDLLRFLICFSLDQEHANNLILQFQNNCHNDTKQLTDSILVAVEQYNSLFFR